MVNKTKKNGANRSVVDENRGRDDAQVSTLHQTIEDLQADVALCKRSLASGGGNANHGPKLDVSKPSPFVGKREARAVDDLLWEIEQYLKAVDEAERLGINATKGSGTIKAVNSSAKPIHGVAKDAWTKIGEYEGTIDLSMVPMDDFKVVLGLEFLDKAIQFKKGFNKSEPCYLAVTRLETDEDSSKVEVPKVIERVLDEFEDVMPKEFPKKLPPRRKVDHTIELESGSKPLAKAPYRMPPPELEELCKQLKFVRSTWKGEILHQGGLEIGVLPSTDSGGRRGQDDVCHEVFQVLRDNELYVKLEKCSFAQDEVEFLGHKIKDGGMMMDGAKIKAIQGWEPPTKVTELRSFLGLVNYYRRFIMGYSAIASPLTDLLKKNQAWIWDEECQAAFESLKKAVMEEPVLRLQGRRIDDGRCKGKSYPRVGTTNQCYGVEIFPWLGELLPKNNQAWIWDEECQAAFESLKKAVMKEPVLRLPDVTIPFELHTDASDFSIGGVLMQDGHPIAFESRKLNETEKKFMIKTDNIATSYFQTQKKLSPKQARWQDFLAEFDYQLEYKPGKANVVADALSRKAEFAAITQAQFFLQDRIKLEHDPLAKKIVALAKDGKTRRFWLKGDMLFTKGDRLYVPKWGDLRRIILRECHDSEWAGHPRIKRTLAL
nr:reverse transcriptase [Tanacetum cinerariifolium]